MNVDNVHAHIQAGKPLSELADEDILAYIAWVSDERYNAGKLAGHAEAMQSAEAALIQMETARVELSSKALEAALVAPNLKVEAV